MAEVIATTTRGVEARSTVRSVAVQVKTEGVRALSVQRSPIVKTQTRGVEARSQPQGQPGTQGVDGAAGPAGGAGPAGPPITAIEVESPSASERILWFRTYTARTVNEIVAVLNGSSTPSVSFSVRYDASRAAVGTELLTGGRTITNTTTGVSYVPDVTTIPADVWVWLQTTAQSGTVLDMIVSMDLSP